MGEWFSACRPVQPPIALTFPLRGLNGFKPMAGHHFKEAQNEKRIAPQLRQDAERRCGRPDHGKITRLISASANPDTLNTGRNAPARSHR